MIYKNYNLNYKELLKKKIILLYGENLSLINEIEEKLIEEAKKELGLSPKKYQENYLLEKPEILEQLLNSFSLLSEQELIIITKTSDKIIEFVNEKTIFYSQKKIILLSDALPKKSRLRSLGENSEHIACIVCYNDTNDQLQKIFEDKLKEKKILISRKFINSIFEVNSPNRQDINDVINKIDLLKKTSLIDEDTIKNIFISSSESDNFELANYCLLGDKKNLNKVLSNLYFKGFSFNEILAALKYKINKLINILESNNNNLEIEKLVENYKPTIFWKEKKVIKDQLKRWDIKELYQCLKVIYKTEINCKKNYEISNIILQQFILSISLKFLQ